MKIYFIRHEDRYDSLSYFTPLTVKGKINTVKLIKDLEKLNLTKIYSSPFIRTLQTIEPFLKNNDIKVNLENSLREINSVNGVPKKESKMTLPEELYNQFNINKKYVSYLSKTDIIYPEESSNVKKRFNTFLKFLIEKYYKTNENILIVSHAGLIEGLIRKLEKKNNDFKVLKKIIPYHYPKGKITMIVENNKLIFQPINWQLS